MSGVDRFDQLISYYQISHRHHHQWQTRLSYYLMEMAMVNSYLLYKKSMHFQNLKPISHYDYRIAIIKHLVAPHFQSMQINGTLGNQHLYFDKPNMEICLKEKTAIEPDKCKLEKMTQKRYCMNCYINNQRGEIRKMTDYWCSQCQAPLCPVRCYDQHRKMKFKVDYN